MSNSLSSTPSVNREITYEEGLALIDDFYENHNISASPDTPEIAPKFTPTFDHARITTRTQAADEARTAAAIAQLTCSPPVGPSKTSPILPSSPPHDHNPHWPADAPISFLTSPVAITPAPLPTPVTSFSNPTTAGASYIASIPSPLQSPTTSPVAAVTTPIQPPTTPATAPPKANIPSTTATPTTTPMTTGSNKAAKKTTTDTPYTPATTVPISTRNVKKQRCLRCVRQHAACNIDIQHPCHRCAAVGDECIPRPEKQPGNAAAATAAAGGARRKSSSAAAAATPSTRAGSEKNAVLVSARPTPTALSWQL